MSENKNSQYDPGLIVKDVHDLHGQSIRVSNSKSIADKYYTHFRITYNNDNLPSEVIYYRGTKSHNTTIVCVSDISGSLQNSYISIRSAPDDKKYHLWFNVNDEGIDPSPEDSTPIEIPISENDSGSLIAFAIKLIINSLFKDYFQATVQNSVVEITTKAFGIVSNSETIIPTFTIQNTPGTQDITNKITIYYRGSDPYYNGQLLKGYSLNVFTGEFEKNEPSSDLVWDSMVTTFPTNTSELYTYSFNGTNVQAVLVEYTTIQKNIIASIQKTRF